MLNDNSVIQNIKDTRRLLSYKTVILVPIVVIASAVGATLSLAASLTTAALGFVIAGYATRRHHSINQQQHQHEQMQHVANLIELKDMPFANPTANEITQHVNAAKKTSVSAALFQGLKAFAGMTAIGSLTSLIVKAGLGITAAAIAASPILPIALGASILVAGIVGGVVSALYYRHRRQLVKQRFMMQHTSKLVEENTLKRSFDSTASMSRTLGNSEAANTAANEPQLPITPVSHAGPLQTTKSVTSEEPSINTMQADKILQSETAVIQR